jgi:hypothetical protein
MASYAQYVLRPISPKILEADAVVSELIDPDAHWWKQSLLNEIFNPEEARVRDSEYISLLVQVTNLISRSGEVHAANGRSFFYYKQFLPSC